MRIGALFRWLIVIRNLQLSIHVIIVPLCLLWHPIGVKHLYSTLLTSPNSDQQVAALLHLVTGLSCPEVLFQHYLKMCSKLIFLESRETLLLAVLVLNTRHSNFKYRRHLLYASRYRSYYPHFVQNCCVAEYHQPRAPLSGHHHTLVHI